MKKVVGYIRVSTHEQRQEGLSLDEQAHMLRGYCDFKQLDLLSIQEDDYSAAGTQDHLVREGYREAIRIAKTEGAVILVPSVDRLARHPNVFSEIIENNLQVISASDGRRLSRKALQIRIERAQRERDLISRRARIGAERARSRGVKLGNTKNLRVAQRQGAISNVIRADRKVQELADFIQHSPGWEELTLSEKVNLLNSSGLLNLVSEKRNERKPWTDSSLRKPLKKAVAELDMRKQVTEDETFAASGFSVGDGLTTNVSACNRQYPDCFTNDPNAPLEVAYRDHPDFGRF